MKNIPLIIVTIIILLTGCSSQLPTRGEKNINTDITPSMVQKEPGVYHNKKAIWGGIIISTKNLKDRTIIEVIYRPANKVSEAGGLKTKQNRFLIDVIGYIDPLTYKKGMKIVAVGSIKGLLIRKNGEFEYPYPVLEPIEMHLYKPKERTDTSHW